MDERYSHSYNRSAKPPEDAWPFHSIGGPERILVPRGESCRKLSFLLGKVDEQGEYSFNGAASCLPDVSGLALQGLGTVPLPLCQEIAQKLASQGTEEQKNLWTLPLDRVQMQNQAWDTGMTTLSAMSAQRLGFNGVTLQPVLTKVLVLAAGGSVHKQPGVQRERCVGTLVVQLPSECTGGNLVVYEEEIRSEVRYTLGKEKAFKPHYAVYSAGAYCAVQQVTSGYCLMMVYALMLPPELPADCGRANRNLIRLQLAENMKLLQGGPDDEDLDETQNYTRPGESGMLALMMSKAFTQTEVEAAGVGALSAVDRNRFQFLKDANIFLESGQKLVFYLVRLRYRVPILGQNNLPEAKQVVQDMTWYLTSGAKIDGGKLHDVKWTKKLNFLNPANETLAQLWENGERNIGTEHERFALIGWPASADIVNSLALFGEVSSIPVILAHSFISTTTLRMLLSAELDGSGNYFAQSLKNSEKGNASVELLPFCRKLGAAIVDLGDTTLVQVFFNKYVAQLKDKDRQLFLQWVPTLVRTFGWANVSADILNAIDVQSTEIRLDRALELADVLRDNDTALKALVVFALKKAHLWCSSHADAFVSSGKIVTLLKNASACGSSQIFSSLSAVLNKIDGCLLHTVIDALAKYVNTSSLPEKRTTLALLAARRRKWLLAEIENTKQPLTWEIPDTNFPNADDIALFLKGSGASFEISGFSGIGDARKRAKVLRQKIKGSVNVVADGRGKAARVQILKAGGEFDTRRKDVLMYRLEADRLGQIVEAMLPQDENKNTFNVGVSGRKRLREADPNIE